MKRQNDFTEADWDRFQKRNDQQGDSWRVKVTEWKRTPLAPDFWDRIEKMVDQWQKLFSKKKT